MEKVVVIVKNGMYLGKFRSDDLRISASFDYHSDFRQALIMPLSAYNEHDGEIREQVNEIAKFAEGEVAVMTMEENIKTLNGDKIYMSVLRELHKEEEEIRDDFARWLIESLLEDE